MKDMLLSLADELEGMDCREGCRTCPADGTNDCRGDLSCEEAVARAVARRVREIVEHDECEVTTVSAYDLLPEDEREAIAWVRERGGLDAVEKRLMPEGMEWPTVDGKPVDFVTGYEPSLGVLEAVSIYNNGACEVMSHDGIVKNATEIHVFKPKVLDADGVEIRVGDVLYSIETGDSVTVGSIEPGNPWFATTDGTLQHCAKFTHRTPVLAADGKPLRAGETVYAKNYGYVKCTVLAIEWVVDGYLVEVENEGGHKFRQTPDEFTHQRPVLDADGVEIREGDEVYIASCGDGPWTVTKITTAHAWHVYGHSDELGSLDMQPDLLTHRAPVLAADGRPLREGEAVWDTKGNGSYIIDAIEGDGVVRIKGNDLDYFGADFTHERPDSWERLEHDAEKTVCEYFGVNGYCGDCPHRITECSDDLKKDLVRRARKLAERGA